MAITNHSFEWNKETKELIEIREGDALTDAQNKSMPGRYSHKTILPEETAFAMVKELERQLRDFQAQKANTDKTLKEIKSKIVPVDKEFFKKWQSCVAKANREQQEQTQSSLVDSMKKIEESLNKVKKAMGL